MKPNFSFDLDKNLRLHRNHPARVKPVKPLAELPWGSLSTRKDYIRRGISVPPNFNGNFRLRGHKNRMAREQAAGRNRAQGILA